MTSKNNTQIKQSSIKRLAAASAITFIVSTGLSLQQTVHADETPAPDIALITKDGNKKLSDFQGQVVLVDFWASWCGPCRQSFPWMNTIQEKYKDLGLVIVGINVDQEPELAEEFLATIPANFTIAYDSEGASPEAFNVMGMPSAYLIDKKGYIHSQHIGFHADKTAEYEAEIKTLLTQPAQ